MVERLRQRSAKPVPVGSTPTHASIFELKRLIRDAFFIPRKYVIWKATGGGLTKWVGKSVKTTIRGLTDLSLYRRYEFYFCVERDFAMCSVPAFCPARWVARGIVWSELMS